MVNADGNSGLIVHDASVSINFTDVDEFNVYLSVSVLCMAND